jgi:hypothetical protein
VGPADEGGGAAAGPPVVSLRRTIRERSDRPVRWAAPFSSFSRTRRASESRWAEACAIWERSNVLSFSFCRFFASSDATVRLNNASAATSWS